MNNVKGQMVGHGQMMCVYLCPLIGLGVIGLHGVQVHLAIIASHSIQTIPQKTNPYCVSAEAHGSYRCPHVCLWVISERKGKQCSCLDYLLFK